MKAVNIAEDEKAVEAVRYLADYCEERHCGECFFGIEAGKECVLYRALPCDWKYKLNAIMKEKQEKWTNRNTKKN